MIIRLLIACDTALYPFDVHNILFHEEKGMTGRCFILENKAKNVVERVKKWGKPRCSAVERPGKLK